MGRSASHIALECALQTRVNCVLIGEEVAQKKQTIAQMTLYLADIISKRGDLQKDFGVILVPEGLIEFIPEMNVLIQEINEIVSHDEQNKDLFGLINEKLTQNSKDLFNFLPKSISEQLLLDRDPHGNVQVAKIDTERLLILLLQTELEKRKEMGQFLGTFTPQSHYFGYEGRCALPSNFDSQYCYALGQTAGALIALNYTGF